MGLGGHLVLVSRNTSGLVRNLENAGFSEGYTAVDSDVRQLDSSVVPEGSFVVHAATPARESLNKSDPLEMVDIIVAGQRRLLEVSASRGATRFLFLSSGAVYGVQPESLAGFDESWTGAPDTSVPGNAYHEAKRVAELMGNAVSSQESLEFVSARLFAFLAPFLPQDEHFAAGNFIRDANLGRKISIRSGGGSVRSYQYGTDMTTWLWATLNRGINGQAYNVGSPDSVTVRELAEVVARESGKPDNVKILGADEPGTVTRYVPDVTKANRELGLDNYVGLPEAVRRTLRWTGES
jgi:dTDP-glucose 4,6-dehydratase